MVGEQGTQFRIMPLITDGGEGAALIIRCTRVSGVRAAGPEDQA